jgi:hypothetical protein
MSRVIELSDEEYETLAAEQSHQTPEAFVARWVKALSDVRGEISWNEEELSRALDADDAELAKLEDETAGDGAAI